MAWRSGAPRLRPPCTISAEEVHRGAGVGPAVRVSVLRGQGVGPPTVKVSFRPGVRSLYCSPRTEHLFIHRIQSHTNPKRRKGFLKQAGQKSVKEELPKQRKGPKRTEECRLKVPTHIWEQDVGSSSLSTRTTFLRKTACLGGFSSFFILFLCLGQLLFSGDFRGRKAARA